jgi:23S rRNA U2552 (ribose-2'-O)-methylase RlmE/FtsJ
MKESKVKRENNVVVVGNFMEEPVRTKIAMELQSRQLDCILIDATPEYSGNQ